MAGERSERGEGREGAGCGVPGSTPAELVATHGGGRCGGRGKREEFGPADKVLGQCGKRVVGGAAGKVRHRVTRRQRAATGCAGSSEGDARGFATIRVRRSPHVCGLTSGRPVYSNIERPTSRVTRIQRLTGDVDRSTAREIT